MSLLQQMKIHPDDRRLMGAYGVAGIVSLAGAGILAIFLVLVRTPAFGLDAPGLYYRSLTGHTILGFVYWFAFIQAALLIAGATVLQGGRRLWGLRLGWIAFAFTAAGLITNMVGVFSGAEVLYTAFPPLAEEYTATPLIYLGYLFSAVGAILITVSFLGSVATWVENRGSLQSWKRMLGEVHISVFAAIACTVLIIAVALAALRLFIPAFLWAGGWMTEPAEFALNYRLTYHVMFHILHYIPAMAMIAVAYVLVELSAGARSVYSKNVAKGLFLMYPAVVPPTFLYHLMTDPSIPETTKIVGSALSLLVWIPSLLHMFIITGMLEARWRSAGHSTFGWIRHLPWKNPAFASLIMGMVTFGVAASLTSVLLQEQTAGLVHGTFAVPAYIHPMLVGAASLIYIAMIYYGASIFGKRDIWGLAIARIQPYLLTVALLIFAIFGSLAGYAGVPRRTAEITYGGNAPESWAGLMNAALGVGGTLTLIAGVMFVGVIGMTLLRGRRIAGSEVSRALASPEMLITREIRYTPTALIPGVLFVVAVLAFTSIALGVMGGWPIQFG